jgi:ketosteroid isomerase-like protein
MGTPVLATPTEKEALDAAAAIVEAFAATDSARYFDGFAPDASFIFHTEPLMLRGRAAYEELWNGWRASGWEVLACESSNPLVTTFPGGAVFVHDVATTVHTPEGRESYRERETIVFRCAADGGLTAIHEHLSPSPVQ